MFGLLESALEIAQAINPQLGGPTVSSGSTYSAGGYTEAQHDEPEEEESPNAQAQIDAAYAIGRLVSERLIK